MTIINPKHDLNGKQFGRLIVDSFFGFHEMDRNAMWNCTCSCGKLVLVKARSLIRGLTGSCGCKNIENHTSHQLSKSAIYRTWYDMLVRCTGNNEENKRNYSDRGITVCSRLGSSPSELVSLIGHKTHKTHSLDRINNNGSYTCGACAECIEKGWPMNIQWATATQQARNRRPVHQIEINGITKTIPEWSETTGVNDRTIAWRLRAGLTGAMLIKETFRKRRNLNSAIQPSYDSK